MISYTPEETEEARQEDLEQLRSEHDFYAGHHLPGSFSYHEALHTASLVMVQMDEPLLGHPAVVLDPEAYRLAHEAHTAIFNLYQYLGAKHLTDEPNEIGPHKRLRLLPLVEDELNLNKDD